MANIGIMGGTFDPIHNGHLLLGRQAYEEYQLNQVWYMPSANPPHKTDHTVTDMRMRGEMVQLAIKQYPFFAYSDFEIRRNGKTYTAQTLNLLHESYPEHTFFFIMGADSLFEIESWYHPEEILGQTAILVANREYTKKSGKNIEEQAAYLNQKYHADVRLLHCEEVDISSAQLREMIRRSSHAVIKYLPRDVLVYIKEHRLYFP